MKKIYSVVIFFLLIGILVLSRINTEEKKTYFFPSMFDASLPVASFSDFWGMILGFRRLTSDLAWIQLLQYYGTHFGEHEHEGHHCPHCLHYGVYENTLKFCQRITRIDPYFHYVYLYGGSTLAWNHGRYDEAITLLKEGIKYDPFYWRYRLYLSAIGYMKEGERKKVIPLLEEAIKYEDCPAVIKVILADFYEKEGLFKEARELWLHILSTTSDKGYRKRAISHLEKIRPPTTF